MSPAAEDRINELHKAHFTVTRLYKLIDEKVSETNANLAQVTGSQYDRLELQAPGIQGMRAEVQLMAARVAKVANETFSTEQAPCDMTGQDILAPLDLNMTHFSEDAAVIRKVVTAWAEITTARMWEQAKRMYNPEENHKEVMKKAATAIVYGFNLIQPNATRKVAGQVELRGNWYAEDLYGGGKTLGYSTARSIGELFQHLRIFAANAAPDATQAMGKGIGLIGALSRNTPIESRERFPLGAGIEMITFYENFRLRLPAEIAQALNMFVSEYAAQKLDQAE